MPKRSFTIINSQGEKERVYIWGATDKEADEKLQRAKIEYEMGLLVVNSKTTLMKWAQEYIEIYKRPNAAEKAVTQYEQIINKVYAPIMQLRLDEIKAAHLQKCVNQYSGMSYSFITKLMQLTKGLFEKAVINGLIVKSPALGLNIPKCEKGCRRAMTQQETDALMQVIDRHEYGLFFALMYGCGCRAQEVRALYYRSIDRKNKILTINNAVKAGTDKIGDTKSKAGVRSIPIPDWLFDKLPSGNNPFELVFVNRQGKVLSENNMKNIWRSFHKEMDLAAGAQMKGRTVAIHALPTDLTPHCLRHTYATELAERGVDIKTAQYLLGHSDIAMTANIYTHITNKMVETARDKINAV